MAARASALQDRARVADGSDPTGIDRGKAPARSWAPTIRSRALTRRRRVPPPRWRVLLHCLPCVSSKERLATALIGFYTPCKCPFTQDLLSPRAATPNPDRGQRVHRSRRYRSCVAPHQAKRGCFRTAAVRDEPCTHDRDGGKGEPLKRVA